MAFSEKIKKEAFQIQSLYRFEWDLEIKTIGSAELEPESLHRVIISREKTLLVLDCNNCTIHQITYDGEFINTIWSDEKMRFKCNDLKQLNDGRIVLCSYKKNCIIIMTKSGVIESILDLNDKLRNIQSICELNNYFLVADSSQATIGVVTHKGEIIKEIRHEKIKYPWFMMNRGSNLYIAESRVNQMSILKLNHNFSIADIRFIHNLHLPAGFCLEGETIYLCEHCISVDAGHLIKIINNEKIFTVSKAFNQGIKPSSVCFEKVNRYLFLYDRLNNRILRARI